MNEKFDQIIALFSTLANEDMQKIGIAPFLLVLVIAAAASILIAYFYTRLYAGRFTGSEIHRAFPLLGISITAIFICIQFSLPLSLGLLGALSIVRFRTPIKEPEEIGFVMLVIAASLACATFNFQFLAIILAVALVALVIKQMIRPVFRRPSQSGMIILSFSEEEYAAKRQEIFDLLAAELKRGGLESISRSEDQVVVNYRFRDLSPQRVPAVETAIRETLGARNTSVVYAAAGVG